MDPFLKEMDTRESLKSRNPFWMSDGEKYFLHSSVIFSGMAQTRSFIMFSRWVFLKVDKDQENIILYNWLNWSYYIAVFDGNSSGKMVKSVKQKQGSCLLR